MASNKMKRSYPRYKGKRIWAISSCVGHPYDCGECQKKAIWRPAVIRVDILLGKDRITSAPIIDYQWFCAQHIPKGVAYHINDIEHAVGQWVLRQQKEKALKQQKQAAKQKVKQLGQWTGNELREASPAGQPGVDY